MGISKLRRLTHRACAVGILVGFALFLIGAQLPYREICLDRTGECFAAYRLIDLTPNPGSNHDAWAVSRWLVRLAPALVAAALLYLPTPIRRRAAGFTIFLAVYLIAVVQLLDMPFPPNDSWRAGGPLALLGALVMLVFGLLVARGDLASGKESNLDPWKLWLPLIVLGMISMGMSVAIDSHEMAYVFALGATVTVSGLLLVRSHSAHGPANRSRSRWAAVPLLIGSALWAASSFVPWGAETEFPTVPIRTEFLFNMWSPYLWEAVVLMVVISGPVLASARLLWRGSAGGLLLGGAIAGSYWTFTLLSAGLRYGEFWQGTPGVYLATVGAALMVIGVLWAALREIPTLQQEPTADEPSQPAVQVP